MQESVSNIAGYRFVELPDRDELREPFRLQCQKSGLKGTILLSHEGINFFLAGSQDGIDQYIDFLEEDERFSNMALKYSYTDYQPFNRMNVRLKKEIISMGMDNVKPAERTGEEITPQEFKQWLDEGKEVAVLDSRATITRFDWVPLRMRLTSISNRFEHFLKRFNHSRRK